MNDDTDILLQQIGYDDQFSQDDLVILPSSYIFRVDQRSVLTSSVWKRNALEIGHLFIRRFCSLFFIVLIRFYP